MIHENFGGSQKNMHISNKNKFLEYFEFKYLETRCGCEECSTSRSEDSLRHSRSRINSYKALASPSLIALSSKVILGPSISFPYGSFKQGNPGP